MKTIVEKTSRLAGIAAMSLLAAALFVINSCDESETPPATVNNNVSFTPCQQSELRSTSESSVNVKFTDEGIEIVYSSFEVTCDFTTVNVTHTLVNGVLNITQQATPSRADCICYTDVSYTIDGISQEEVNVIFINDVQVYCYNENYPKEVLFEEYSLEGTSCLWRKVFQDEAHNNAVAVINSKEELENYIECIGESDYSKVDFSKYTLLLAYGVEPHWVTLNHKSLQQLSAQNYVMKVNLSPGIATVITHWQVPIVISKKNDNVVIELIVTKNS